MKLNIDKIKYKKKIITEIHDERGILTEVILGDWKQINTLFSKYGTVRGNHYHKKTKEFFYIINGGVNFTLMNIRSKKECLFTAIQNDLIVIPTYHFHKLEFLSDTLMLSGYTIQYDPKKPDIYLV